MTELRRFIVNLFGSTIGLLKLGDVIFDKKWKYIAFWWLVPTILIIWSFLTLENLSLLGPLWFLLAIYGVLWIGFSIYEINRITIRKRFVKGIMARVLLYAFTFFIVGWVGTTFIVIYPAMGGLHQSFFTRVHWWALGHVISTAVVIVAIIILCQRFINIHSHTDRSVWIASLAPMIGVHGLHYLISRRFVLGGLFLLIGWMSLTATIWASNVDLFYYSFALMIVAQAILYLAPLLYFLLWVWPATEVAEANTIEKQDATRRRAVQVNQIE